MTTEDPWASIRAAGLQIAEALQVTADRIDRLLAEATCVGIRVIEKDIVRMLAEVTCSTEPAL